MANSKKKRAREWEDWLQKGDTSLLDNYRIEKISELEKSKNPGIGFQILHFVDTENPDTDTRITLERHYAR